jgi:dCMP deaminase
LDYLALDLSFKEKTLVVQELLAKVDSEESEDFIALKEKAQQLFQL